MKDINILIVGVGGQGTLLASVLLGGLAMKHGMDVKLSEVHGMAQRGGSVVTHVRMSENPVCAPLIDKGCADIILAFEQLEALRYLDYLKPGGKIFVNVQKIMPMTVLTGSAKYPDGSVELLESKSADVTAVDALAVAEELGNIKTVNVIMMGVLSHALDFSERDWMHVIEENVKPKFIEINKAAFEKGRALV